MTQVPGVPIASSSGPATAQAVQNLLQRHFSQLVPKAEVDQLAGSRGFDRTTKRPLANGKQHDYFQNYGHTEALEVAAQFTKSHPAEANALRSAAMLSCKVLAMGEHDWVSQGELANFKDALAHSLELIQSILVRLIDS